MKHILLIDNYDSFVYNLYQLVRETELCKIDVVRNDKIDMESIDQYDGIIISPGPGIPSESGQLMDLLQKFHDKKPILGVCLGHQAIAEFFGATLVNIPIVVHGKSDTIQNLQNQSGIMKDMAESFIVGRYHSWVVDQTNLPECLNTTAQLADGTIMGLQHQTLPIFGVQFHPESILTPVGKEIMRNWFNQLETISTQSKRA